MDLLHYMANFKGVKPQDWGAFPFFTKKKAA